MSQNGTFCLYMVNLEQMVFRTIEELLLLKKFI